MKLQPCIASALLVFMTSLQAQQATVTIDAATPGHDIAPTLWGIFFEDINLSADGGLYPELVRNRSFEDADRPEHWTFSSIGGNAEVLLSTADVHGQPVPLNCFNRTSLRIRSVGAFSLRNDGYWGMNFVKGERYSLRLAARGEPFGGVLTARLLSRTGEVLASGEIAGFQGYWDYYSLELTPAGSDPQGRLELIGEGSGTLYLDMVSLLPQNTWKGHGLRTDLAQSLADLSPAFFRFPGGCWVEGDDFAHMLNWKNTVGSTDTRTPLWNIWGYNATHGLGYHEYLQFAEDLGAEPLFCINIGMSHKETVPMDCMAQWVQDALDAIEYANGSVDSVWGAMRAAAGHPEPFNLRYLELGNENGGFSGYVERWKLFYKAIKAEYPEMIFVANGWNNYGDCPADIVDDHYYNTPDWFIRNAGLYDHIDRNGPKVFVGEYAVNRDCGQGNLRGAIGEAAFMTGLERNSDIVCMAAYAPLLVNLNHRAWNPDLINFDSSGWYGLPSYYVQQMFAQNQGDIWLPTAVKSPPVQSAPQCGRVGVGTWNTSAEFAEIRVTDPQGGVLFESDFSQGTDGWKLLDGNWSVQGGALRQSEEDTFIRALAGDPSWSEYTLSLKARKLSGSEGFLILFNIAGDYDRTWWNIGGWNNSQSALESNGTQDGKPFAVETGRWYDIELTVAGGHVQCRLDGKLIHDVDLANGNQYDSIYATAATDAQTGKLLVKLVNVAPGPVEVALDVQGMPLSGRGSATVLTSESPTDENSLDEPRKVFPKTHAVAFPKKAMTYSCPGNSLTVLRLEPLK